MLLRLGIETDVDDDEPVMEDIPFDDDCTGWRLS